MAFPSVDPIALLAACGTFVETLQQNPAGAVAALTLAFFALVAWVVHKLGK